jgi:hypothetical protein
MDQKLVDLAKNLKVNGLTQDEVLRELRKANCMAHFRENCKAIKWKLF